MKFNQVFDSYFKALTMAESLEAKGYLVQIKAGRVKRDGRLVTVFRVTI